MNDQRVKTDNEAIAEFMGALRKYDEQDGMPCILLSGGGVPVSGWYYNDGEIKYATSWEWLMPVVTKIDQLYHAAFPGNEEFIRRILAKEEPLDGPYMDVIALPLATPIKEVYEAIIKFIHWYNENKTGKSS